MKIFTLITFITLIIYQPVFGQSDVIVPLSVGNYWEYIDSTFYDDTLFVVDTTKLGITGEINIEYQGNNYDVYYWNWFEMSTNPPQPEPLKWLIRNEADGLWEYGMLNDTDTLLLQNLNLKFPANIGDGWPIMLYVISDTIRVLDTLAMKCLDTNKEYITPSGIFQCYVYHYPSGFLKSPEANYFLPFEETKFIHSNQIAESDTLGVLLYFAPNVGFVGLESNFETFKRKKYLISYNLITDVNINENNLNGFQLCQNYPNPFNPSTQLKYSIPQASNVVIKVFDILGNKIETLVNEEKTAGIYDLTWNAANLPSGVYFYQLRAVDPSTGSGQVFIQTKKMILLK